LDPDLNELSLNLAFGLVRFEADHLWHSSFDRDAAGSIACIKTSNLAQFCDRIL
jgi:hypothetical protein